MLYHPQTVRSWHSVHLGVRCPGKVGLSVFLGLAIQPLAQTIEDLEDP